MVVQCSHCRKKYRVALSTRPDTGLKARCVACGETFTLRPGADSSTDKVIVRPTRVMAWVLTGDPGVDQLVSGVGLEALRQHLDVTVVAPDARARFADRFADGDLSAPEALVFGDLHILLEDPLVLQLARRSACRRVLVSTHRNTELLARASRFAGVDAHLTAPFEPDDLLDALGLLAR